MFGLTGISADRRPLREHLSVRKGGFIIKLITAGLLILAVLLLACVGAVGFVTAAVENTEALLEEAEAETVRIGFPARLPVRAASEQWQQYAPIFGMLLHHEKLDNIAADFAQLAYYAETGEQDAFLSTCASLLVSLRHIREMEQPTLQNIL